jgi:hypothetical protein
MGDGQAVIVAGLDALPLARGAPMSLLPPRFEAPTANRRRSRHATAASAPLETQSRRLREMVEVLRLA